MLLYYITDRRQFRGSAEDQQAALLNKIGEAARSRVDYIQLREKDLSARELLQLAQAAQQRIRDAARDSAKPATRLLINSRLDVALACGAAGVHVRSDDISPAEARAVATGLATGDFLIAASCHSPEEVRRAAAEGADFVVFAPVFEKGGQPGVGIEALRRACGETVQVATPEPSAASSVPVFALGGVTLENAQECLQAGATGIAGIRLFQDNKIAQVVARLRP